MPLPPYRSQTAVDDHEDPLLLEKQPLLPLSTVLSCTAPETSSRWHHVLYPLFVPLQWQSSFTCVLQAAKHFKMVPGYETDYTPTQVGENAQQVLVESRALYQST